VHPTLASPEDGTTPATRLLPAWAGQCSLSLPSSGRMADALASIPLPEALARAVSRRQLQFRAGRYCAWMALEALGEPGHVVPRGANGAPVWPAGFTGSITHSDDFASAVAARVRDARAIGIDTEPTIAPARAARVAPVVASAGEMDDLARAGLSWLEALTLAFSAKEATFKCLHPLVGRMFGFQAVRIAAVDGSTGQFQAGVVTPLGDAAPAGTVLEGRFAFDGARVHTAVSLPAEGR
jgi:enterobactin synthetase component D